MPDGITVSARHLCKLFNNDNDDLNVDLETQLKVFRNHLLSAFVFLLKLLDPLFGFHGLD